jgi:putative ABC transport system permease protein
MNVAAALRLAVQALRKNRGRSLLTTLGIIIGVAAVITMVALTQSAKATIEAQMMSLGGSVLMVSSTPKARSGVSVSDVAGSADGLTIRDAAAIRKLRMVTHVSPLANTRQRVIRGSRNWFTPIVGASADFATINDWLPERGTFFTPDDVTSAENVCVIGTTVAYQLFGYQGAIGETLRIGPSTFRVIGVLSSKGQTLGGKDQDDLIVMPYTTLQKRLLGTPQLTNIAVAVRTQQDLPVAVDAITRLLRERHQIRPGLPDPFSIKTQLDLTQKIVSIVGIMTVLLGSIASISLIVGGIGIMNIMLVSVTERIREIGIRMAVGAKARDILLQFLIESVILSLGGGVLGIVVGVGVATLASVVAQWPLHISWGAIVLAFTFSAIVGIFFGLYPARKAARLDPIEALRYE